ncbi:DUF4087 domain-containing protein [Aestuariibius insulae]|uniref:DUF4087 domain-containing protein n=1 Tax=Aestuariibius insulae TaxID=2058287 RepID=UPI00345E5990
MRGVALALCFCAVSAGAETRCGWYENPTPANQWLVDRDGMWVLSTQGGLEAPPGFYNLPEAAFAFDLEWVSSNGEPGDGYYGYGCACIEGAFEAPGTVLRVDSMRPVPLMRCEEDPDLPAR